MEGEIVDTFVAQWQDFLAKVAGDPVDYFSNFYSVEEPDIQISSTMKFNDEHLCAYLGHRSIASATEREKEKTKNKSTMFRELIVPLDTLRLYITNELFIHTPFFKALEQKLYECGYPDMTTDSEGNGYLFVVSDPFTHSFLTNLFLYTFFSTLSNNAPASRNKFVPFVVQYGTTVCAPPADLLTNGIHMRKGEVTGVRLFESTDGHLVNVYSLLGNEQKEGKNKVTVSFREPSVCDHLLRQVLVALSLLQDEMQFSYGGLRAQHVALSSKEPIEAVVSNVPIRSQWRCLLNLEVERTISFSVLLGNEPSAMRTRFLSSTDITDTIKEKIYVPPTIQTYVAKTKEGEEKIAYFQLQSAVSMSVFKEMKEMGIPYFVAFDTYSFLASVFCVPIFYNTIMTNALLKEKYWEPLFLDDADKKELDKRVREFHKRESYVISDLELVSLLKDLKMRCDISERVLAHLHL